MGRLAVGVAVRIQVPPRSEKGGPRGRDCDHFGGLSDWVLNGDKWPGLTINSVLQRSGEREDVKLMRDASDEEFFRAHY